jgi:hypothetical protein
MRGEVNPTAKSPQEQRKADAMRRIMAWLRLDGNGVRLSAEAKRLYREDGRGFWLASEPANPSRQQTEVLWYRQDQTGLLPSDAHRRELERMVRTYDPRIQFVLVVMEDDDTFFAKIRCIQQVPEHN